MTYRDILSLVSASAIDEIGINPYFLDDGGNPGQIFIVGVKSAAFLGKSEEEFGRRAKKYRWLDFL